MPVDKLAINLDHYFDKKLFYSVRLCWCTETAFISKICADAKRTLKVMAGIVRYSRQLFLLNSRITRSLTHSFLGVKFSIFSDYLSMKLGYSVIFDVLPQTFLFLFMGHWIKSFKTKLIEPIIMPVKFQVSAYSGSRDT